MWVRYSAKREVSLGTMFGLWYLFVIFIYFILLRGMIYLLYIIERYDDDVIRCSRCPRKGSRWLATTLLGEQINRSGNYLGSEVLYMI